MRIIQRYIPAILILCLAATRLPAQKSGMLYRPFRSHLQKGTIKDFLDEINAGSGVQIEYSSVSFRAEKVISLDDDILTLGALLQQVLSGEKVKPIEKNDKIILIPSNTPLADDALLPLYSFFGIISEEEVTSPCLMPLYMSRLRTRQP